ncbi:MAG: transcription termination/antitermination protein NusG [Thermodesulfobacteriota bacterium]
MSETDQINETDEMNERDEKDASTHWYVIQTKPCDEHRVETHLLNQEIETFLPLVGAHQYSNGKMVRKIKPLFPNYLFARLDLKVHYYRVKWTRGVSKILGIGTGPVPVSEKVVQTIREKIGEDNLVRLEEGWKEGDTVQVTSGPFKELMGIFQKKMSENGRVRILLSLIGVDVPVQISRWQIKRVA